MKILPLFPAADPIADEAPPAALPDLSTAPEVRGLEWAYPLVREWFVARFGTPTEPQEQSWPSILAGKTTLICAPTGSGKTLAAFLACIDGLVRRALSGQLDDRIRVLYVSPLKALGNDIQKNLEQPLGEILQLAGRRGLLMPPIRTAVRTGDTLQHERRVMLQRPPQILVTTPESLYILLTADKSRALLRDVETVIVDEIHAVAGSKRGAHLALSLERLSAITHTEPVRIGLSATQKPLAEIARFLTGTRPDPVIVNIGHRRHMDVAIEVPASELSAVATNEMWGEIYDRIAALAQEPATAGSPGPWKSRSTLLFVNTRRLAERVALHLAERLGEHAVAAHHGSLSRKLRLEAERKLKCGEIQVLVATASLELGIDIGFVDLVVQIGSTRSIAVALQRIGRSGHWRGATPRARIFATTRDELIECAALVRAIHAGDLDRILLPPAPLDVLAQQIVAECASVAQSAINSVSQLANAEAEALGAQPASGYDEDELYRLLTRAHPYRDLPRPDFDAVIEMLSEGIAARRGRYGAYLHRDRVHHRVRARRGARLVAITCGGAIPDSGLFTMVSMPEGITVGTLDEDFAVESNAGDIILLGNTSWKIRRVEGSAGRVLVEDAHGAPPSVPFWRGEAPARTVELSQAVAALRHSIAERLPTTPAKAAREIQKLPEVNDAIAWLKRSCGLNDSGAEQAIDHILMGRAVLGTVPTQQTIVAERFFDEGGGMQLVIHAPFGARVNKAWGLALRKRFCRSFNFELQASATDDGISIALAEQHSFPLGDVFHYLQPDTVQNVLEQAVLTANTPIFTSRWRWDAQRALALPRFQHGRKVPPQIQRIRSDDLLASVFPDVAACFENIAGEIRPPDHPLVKEVMKDVLHEAMDVDALREILAGIESGAIKTVAVDTPVPSQFSHEILNANPYAYLDDAPLEERRARAVQMRSVLPETLLQEVGRLDPEAIAEVSRQAWPDVRDADELQDALASLVLLPASQAYGRAAEGEAANADWQPLLEQLAATGRAGVARISGEPYYVAAERRLTFEAMHSAALWDREPVRVAGETPLRSDAIFTTVTGWMQHLGPTTASELTHLLALPTSEIEQALLRGEASGSILRGHYRSENALQDNETEWCERRLLARIHRLTVGRLRREIEPVTPAQFMNWLFAWQHVAAGTQQHGARGLLQVLDQLQGCELPANAWEVQVLARRLSDYAPATLDDLCLTGVIGWGRLSPHPAVGASADSARRRVVPTSVAPITFFVREKSAWMAALAAPEAATPTLSHAALSVLDFLRARGASFFTEIVAGTFKLKAEIETALWELVTAGLVTADGFDNLRSLIDPRRRAGHGHARSHRPRNAAGRWALLGPQLSATTLERDSAESRGRAAESTCWMLLARYGVVFRELLIRENLGLRWRELLLAFRRLEDRGEIRGGRFVSGFLGEQFALPSAVESLRAARRQPPTGETITIAAADPLNLVGIVVPGERIAAVSGRYVSFRDGVPLPEAPRLSPPLQAAVS